MCSTKYDTIGPSRANAPSGSPTWRLSSCRTWWSAASRYRSFLDEQDEDGYVWIRRFDNERDRERGYAAVYETPRWTDEIGPRVYELLDVDRTVVTRPTPTTVSALR